MILTVNNDPSSRLTSEMVRLLKEECDDVTPYEEAGWFCVIGYKGDRRLVNAHCDSREQYEVMMGIRKPDVDPRYSWGM